MRRLLEIHHIDHEQCQRENLFHTRYKVYENLCSVIVDSGSCCNSCSSRLVDKLALITILHPKPYKLQYIKDDGGIMVKDQLSIPIWIGNYKEKVFCDVAPMEVGHMLLGRQWQFDKHTIHDGLTNKISSTHKGKKCTLSSHTPTSEKGPNN